MKILDQNALEYANQHDVFGDYDSSLTYEIGDRTSYDDMFYRAISSGITGSFNSPDWSIMGGETGAGDVTQSDISGFLEGSTVDSRITANAGVVKGYYGAVDAYTTEEIVDISVTGWTSAVAVVSPFGSNGGQRNMFIQDNDDDSVVVAIDSSYIEAINFKLLVVNK